MTSKRSTIGQLHDVKGLASAGWSEDEIFQLTVASAL